MSEEVPWQRGLEELGRAFRRRSVSPVEVLETCIERIEHSNAHLNAIVTLQIEEARAAALASDRRWAKGEPLGPLDGVPLTVKDNLLAAGARSTWGSRLFADFVPDADELPVALARSAGLVIIGKTNVPEFTVHGYTDNPLFGVTRNPWNPSLTPGGSSGGAVSAVAAGMVPLAVATDGGGSIRRPASHTGLIGFKPSIGRVPRNGGFPKVLHDFEVVGPVARRTGDAALLFSVLAAPSLLDRTSLGFAPAKLDLSEPAPQRILFVPSFGAAPVDAEIADSVATAARGLETLGHSVREGDAPFDSEIIASIWPVISQAGIAWMLRRHPECESKVGASLIEMANAGLALGAIDYVEALAAVSDLRERLDREFSSIDLIMTPTAAALPWPAEKAYPDTIDGKPVGPRGHAIFTGFANAAGLPAITIPCAPSAAGLPIGFQLVGRFGADDLLFKMAAQYERAWPWAHRWPGQVGHVPLNPAHEAAEHLSTI